jgi:hypothetical protein
MPVIPMLRRLRQKDLELEVILFLKSCLEKKKFK